jgi:hypothetical protein
VKKKKLPRINWRRVWEKLDKWLELPEAWGAGYRRVQRKKLQRLVEAQLRRDRSGIR